MKRPRRNDPTSGFFSPRELSWLSTAMLMLVILAMLIASASRASTWTWLTGEAADRPAAFAEKGAAADAGPRARQELVVPGDTRADDREEQEAAEEEFEAVSDQTPLAAEEMPGYWRLLRWARSESFADLHAHARRDVLYTQLWERPEKYRGQLIELRLHLARGLEHEAPENSAGFRQVSEVWGWTDESQSFPYVAVLVARPPQLKLGAKIDQEVTFVGYFLKTMAYTDALGNRRASPLLLGRLQCHERMVAAASHLDQSRAFWRTIAAGVGLLLAIAFAFYRRGRSPRRSTNIDAGKIADTESWLKAVEDHGEDTADGQQSEWTKRT